MRSLHQQEDCCHGDLQEDHMMDEEQRLLSGGVDQELVPFSDQVRLTFVFQEIKTFSWCPIK